MTLDTLDKTAPGRRAVAAGDAAASRPAGDAAQDAPASRPAGDGAQDSPAL
jgi:hypothetical protein